MSKIFKVTLKPTDEVVEVEEGKKGLQAVNVKKI